MENGEMLRLFESHREAEAARDIDAILETFTDDCFLETMPLGLRAEGREAVRAAYEQQFSRSGGRGHGVRRRRRRRLGNAQGNEPRRLAGGAAGRGIVRRAVRQRRALRAGLMAGERIYFDLATLCEQARIPLESMRAAAAAFAALRR